MSLVEHKRKIEVDGKIIKFVERYRIEPDGRIYFENICEVMELYDILGIERFYNVRRGKMP